jgi:xanthine dehydrogenase small subunit
MTQATNTVRFVLDGAIVEASGERRTTTVLNYLREQLRRNGTKEGCAEGDCGACVVLVGELNEAGTAVDYLPVNSCLQLLPTLDGKSVKTVESLKKADGALHPVQQAMMECHGSQCGFCTPGVVMSLAGLMNTLPEPSRAQITDSLSGNLCRCTGYKPIIDAAHKASAAGPVALKIDDSPATCRCCAKSAGRARRPTTWTATSWCSRWCARARATSSFRPPPWPKWPTIC